jgi:hypothetical protein
MRRGVFRRIGLGSTALDRALSRLFFHLGMPVDQTSGAALAQIQVISRKVA